MKAPTSSTSSPQRLAFAAVLSGSVVVGLGLAQTVWAQSPAPSSSQRATAAQVAQAGIPLSELAPDAPAEYTVKRGDTLWAIAGIFLKSPWRWPELWGMNMQEVRNPHRIYPGQQLFLDKSGGLAKLRMGARTGDGEPPTEVLRVSPRSRSQTLADSSIPALEPRLIEPFLAEPLIVTEDGLLKAPRIVATQEGRVLLTRGDRAYARNSDGTPMADRPGPVIAYRVFRNVKPLKDPVTNVVLGYEAQYVGAAELVRGETSSDVVQRDGKTEKLPVAAAIDIVSAKEEMRVGDRLLPDPPRELLSYVPRAPLVKVDGSIVSMYGNSVATAGQSQIVVINKGTADGIERGHVLAILKGGAQIVDRTQPGERSTVKIPDERNGLLMVFRPFEKLSYALVLEIADGVKSGDRVVNPR